MTFGAPQFLYVLAVLPALLLFVWWAQRHRAASVRRIGDLVLLKRLSLSTRPRDAHHPARSLVRRRLSAHSCLGSTSMG